MSSNDPRDRDDVRNPADTGADPIKARRDRMAQRLRDELASLVAMDLLQGLAQGGNDPRRHSTTSRKAA